MGRTIDQLTVGDKVFNHLGGTATITNIKGGVVTTSTGLDWGWNSDQEWLVSIPSDNDQEPANGRVFDLKRLGQQLHQWGANVTATKGKKPISNWREWQKRRQTVAELDALPWMNADGVGIVNGSGNLRCTDIDAAMGQSVPAEYVVAWLEALGLPEDYTWCYRSASGRGWHIWARCEHSDFSGVLTLKPKGNVPEVDHIELRWSTGQTVLKLEILPSEPPVEVSFTAVQNALESLTIPKDSNDPEQQKPITEREKSRVKRQSAAVQQTSGEYQTKPTPEEIARALSFIPAHTDYNEGWLRMLMAVHSVYPDLTGVELIEAWSPGNEGEVAEKFRSFERTAKNGVNIGTLFHIAKGYGWRPKRIGTTEEAAQESKMPIVQQRNLTDLGNAERFIDEHGAGLRYVPAWDQWHLYTGRYWKRDDKNHVNYLARETVRAIYANAAQEDDESERKRLASHALRSESRGKQRAMTDLAKDDPRITIDHTDLDANPWFLNVMNGTLDLRTAELLPHDPDDLITRLIREPYDPSAQAPHWLTFLDRVLDKDLIPYLQRAVGYSLTGVTYEQCLFFLYGIGRNGKSTCTNALLDLFGDYGARTQAETLLVKNYGGGASNDLARLPGTRFVVASEVEEGRSLAESLVKDVTGGDTITARFLYQEHFEFRPQFKLWMYGNHKPNVRGTDDGIWRRMRLIPFNVQIPPDEVDRTLPDKLREELPGILNWAVQGCLDWQRRGNLGEPEAVIQATADYRTEQDILAEFLDLCTEIATGEEIKATDIYAAYAGWAEEHGEKSYSARWLGLRLRDRGFAKVRQSSGYYWQNVQLSEAGKNLQNDYHIKKG